jgi:hypothetical protein
VRQKALRVRTSNNALRFEAAGFWLRNHFQQPVKAGRDNRMNKEDKPAAEKHTDPLSVQGGFL